MPIKDTIKLWKNSPKAILRGIYLASWFSKQVITRTLTPIRFVLKAEFRSEIILRYTRGEEAHQIVNFTAYNRYPDLFSSCQKHYGKEKDIKILSFGCSTGEEVLTLRTYFPNAFILGVDINGRNIKQALKKKHDENIVFSHDIDKAIATHGPFDLIFALAVLQRTENRNKNTTDSSTIYPFAKFNSTLKKLDHHLNLGGLLTLDHTDYLLEHSAIAEKYQPLPSNHAITHERYLFDNNNQRMPEFVEQQRIYLKQTQASP